MSHTFLTSEMEGGSLEEPRRQREVLTTEKLWSGSCDEVMLGTLAGPARPQAQPPHWRDDLWAHRGPSYLQEPVILSNWQPL